MTDVVGVVLSQFETRDGNDKKAHSTKLYGT